jgi:hypothetical protein
MNTIRRTHGYTSSTNVFITKNVHVTIIIIIIILIIIIQVSNYMEIQHSTATCAHGKKETMYPAQHSLSTATTVTCNPPTASSPMNQVGPK